MKPSALDRRRQALAYAERGLRVLPLQAAAKAPATQYGVKDASTDPDQISRWWHTSPAANLGIATGGGLVVVDVDPRHGGDDSLHELERDHGQLPKTVRVKTGGGGEHFYFKAPASIGCSAGRIASGIDVKGAGGYVVAPPSVHESGRPYAFDCGFEDVPLAEIPEWLLGKLTRPGASSKTAPPTGKAEEIPEGRRDSTLLSLAGSMRRVGMTGVEIHAALQVVNRNRCRPPISEAKVQELAMRAGSYPAGTPRVPTPEAAEAARELSDLLNLPSIGLAVAGCRIVGTGREASGDIFLSDGRTITFPKLTWAMQATVLMEQVVSTVGAQPSLKNAAARRVVALMRRIGQIEESESDDARVTQYGRDFLATADVLDVNMSDQAERWGAFMHLREREPTLHARAHGISIARASIVLRDLDGTLYVRTAWFKAHVRATEDSTLSPAALATLMQRVGWRRPGKKGRIKAKRPNLDGSDFQSFYVVPPGWDGMDTAGVTPGDPTSTDPSSDPLTPGDPFHARPRGRAGDKYTPGVTGSPGVSGPRQAA